MPFVPSKNKTGTFRLPSLNRFEQQLGRLLGDSLRKPKAVRLGNPETGELFVSDDTSLVYISGYGDESDGISTMPRAGIPREYLKLNQTITVKKQKNAYAYVGIDIDTGGLFNEGIEDQHDQSPISISQLDFGTLQPYSGMVAVVKGMLYGDDAVIDLLTADFSASPNDTLSNPINIPTNNNRAIGVLVQLDATTSTLSYKQSAEFNASLSLAQAYDSGLLPLRDEDLWRIGYVRLIAGITSLDNSTIWTCPEFLTAPGGELPSIGEPEILTLSTDKITYATSYNIVVAAQTGTSDFLNEILGTFDIGTRFWLRADTGDTITVVHNSGSATNKIHLLGDANRNLDAQNPLVLVQVATNVLAEENALLGTITGSTGGVDNAILVSNGTGGSTLEASVATLNPATGVMAGASISEGANYVGYGAANNVTLDTNGRFNAAGVAHAVVAAFSGTADDLTSITGISDIGRRIAVRGLSGHTITVKHNDAGSTVKILLNNDTDVVLDSDNPLILVLTETTKWSQIYDSGGGGANTALSNLASVAINTSLISDTDNTDDLGSSATKWRAAYTNAAYLEERSAPSTPSSGDLAIYADTNGKPVSLNDAGVSRMLGTLTELVAPTELGSSQTTITFSSIPAHFQDLIVVIRPRSTSTGTAVVVTFNADTGNTYAKNTNGVDGTGTHSAGTSYNQTSITCNNSSASSGANANYFGHLHFYITGYAETGKTRNGHWVGNRVHTDTANHARQMGSFFWENTANAISSIELNLDAGDFDTGTIYALYGVGTAA